MILLLRVLLRLLSGPLVLVVFYVAGRIWGLWYPDVPLSWFHEYCLYLLPGGIILAIAISFSGVVLLFSEISDKAMRWHRD